MILESRIEKMVGELRARTSLPLAIELWNGKRYALGDRPTVTLRVPAATALRYLVNADLGKLGEAYVEGHIDVEGPIGDAMRAAEGLARGWGALVMHAAQRYGAQALGITLSRNQHALANERIKAAGLADRCEVRMQDYRDVGPAGAFDKIASIGMFEHVGLKNLPVYFGAIRELLAEGGIVLNHGITSVDPDSRSVGMGASDFVEKYVFPHGELPHLSLVVREMGAAGLEVMDVETWRLHYAKTLHRWSERLEANLDKARTFAGEKRARIWRTYLAGCAHAFDRGWVSIQQVLATKSADPRKNPLPWSRDYMYGG